MQWGALNLYFQFPDFEITTFKNNFYFIWTHMSCKLHIFNMKCIWIQGFACSIIKPNGNLGNLLKRKTANLVSKVKHVKQWACSEAGCCSLREAAPCQTTQTPRISLWAKLQWQTDRQQTACDRFLNRIKANEKCSLKERQTQRERDRGGERLISGLGLENLTDWVWHWICLLERNKEHFF